MRETRGWGTGLKLDAKECGRSELWEHKPVKKLTNVLRGERREAKRQKIVWEWQAEQCECKKEDRT